MRGKRILYLPGEVQRGGKLWNGLDILLQRSRNLGDIGLSDMSKQWQIAMK